MRVKNLIIGAGPTGLGAAHRLAELGDRDFVVLERNDWAGGLAASFTDDAGFTWDIGGHVVFSHYDYFDRLMDSLLGEESLWHERESWVRACATWVPYPFQNNIRHLPPDARWDCVRGLLPGNRPEGTPANFREWMLHVFGQGICDHFLLPYNFKVWATPPELMNASWVGERVSVVDLEGVLKNICMERDDVGWGPNNRFRFPERGGTGEIFRRMAAPLREHILYGQSVVRLDTANKKAVTAEGLEVEYDAILNTAPLDRLCLDWLHAPSPELADAAKKLKHNSVYVAGVGVDSMREDSRCWMYFPEPDSPCYRLTNFHNYSPNNVAKPGQQRALMCETSFSSHKPEKLEELMDRTVQGLLNTTLLDESEAQGIVSRWEISVDYGYPVPCLERDRALQTIQSRLEEHRIFSRGRFGGWKYEVANMDHSVMQGVEWADYITAGTPETTYSWK